MIKRSDYTTAVACRSEIAKIDERVKAATDEALIRELTEDMLELRDRESELVGLEQRAEAAKGIAEGSVTTTVVERGGNMEIHEQSFGVGSPEYKSAWLKRMAVDSKGNYMLGGLTEVEERAYTMTTANSKALVPTVIMDKIKDLVHAETPLFDDATQMEMEEGFAIPVRKGITAGDAAVTAEDKANEDEEDNFVLVPMPGVDIKKHATMTRRMKFQSIDSFESWLVSDISKRIGVAKEKVIIARLTKKTPAVGVAANDDVAIADENILTDATYDDKTIRKIMAMIDEAGQIAIYANRNTIYNGFAGIENTKGEKLFVESAMVDPTVKGVMYGGLIKVDPNLADNEAFFGVIGAVHANENVPLEVFPTVEAKTGNIIFTGTSVFDGGLTNPKSFVHVTFQ